MFQNLMNSNKSMTKHPSKYHLHENRNGMHWRRDNFHYSFENNYSGSQPNAYDFHYRGLS